MDFLTSETIMEKPAHTDKSYTPFPTNNANPSEGTLNRAVAGAHSVVDKAVTVADDAVRMAKPAIDRVAGGAHQAVDKAARVAVPTAKWLAEQSESLRTTQHKILGDARKYVSANPIKSVAAALVTGLLIGRILR
jgi:ElaB/YqjD/DUF883 family membrane-anchored ribosome-binding protein